jgi:hypothetical protein
LVNGVLDISCGGSGDLIQVKGNLRDWTVDLAVNGTRAYSFPADEIKTLTISGIAGSDQIKIDPKVQLLFQGHSVHVLNQSVANSPSADIAALLHHIGPASNAGVLASAMPGERGSAGLPMAMDSGAYANADRAMSHMSGAIFSGTDLADHDLVMSTPKRGCVQGKSAPYCNCQQAQPAQVRSSESESANKEFAGPTQPREKQDAAKQANPAANKSDEEDQARPAPATINDSEQTPTPEQTDAFFEVMGQLEQPSAPSALVLLGTALFLRMRSGKVSAQKEDEERERPVGVWRRSLN